jgi:hypothetical protein
MLMKRGCEDPPGSGPPTRYAKEVRDAFEMWSQHIETLTTLSRLAGDVTSFRNQASAVSKIRDVF